MKVQKFPIRLPSSEGIAPSQYGTKGLVGDKLAEVEEKYDLSADAEGFGEEGAKMEMAMRKNQDLQVKELMMMPLSDL